MLDGEPDFRGRSLFWLRRCIRFSESLVLKTFQGRHLGDGAVVSSADWCVGTVHIMSVRRGCKRMLAMLDGDPDFQGRSHLWLRFCRRFSEGFYYPPISIILLYLGYGAVVSGADLCVGTARMPSVRQRCE
jgi:hypothetical protein